MQAFKINLQFSLIQYPSSSTDLLKELPVVKVLAGAADMRVKVNDIVRISLFGIHPSQTRQAAGGVKSEGSVPHPARI